MTPLATPLSEYDFELPRELIAQHPTGNREDARLLVVDRKNEAINHQHFRDLPTILDSGDCLVLNNTRVLLAKLVGYREKTGGRWQGLYLEHDRSSGIMQLMCKTRGRIKPDETVILQDREGVDRVTLRLLARLENGTWAARVEPALPVESLLENVGRVPLPHYIRDGNMVDADIDDYQTVFARNAGSIAAPTAGLHFTQRLLNQLVDRGIRLCTINLNVGTGTFRPITADSVEEHRMHAEFAELDQTAAATINETRQQGGRIVATGTTTTRLLESFGAKPALEAWSGETRLYIGPAHRFQQVDALITNFHLPRTTLLVLVRSFGGDRLIRRAYEEAVRQEYRFFSYGDAMLILQ